ncbi:MAG: universal stress protein [Bacteroidetes bacterium]|nr:universal stress protein [Bacteroidota bacterium]
MKFKNLILVPTDFSDVCHNAIDHAVKIATNIDFKVVIYHVINKDTHAAFKGEQSLNAAVAQKLQNIVDEYKLQFDVDISFTYEEGSIFELIHKKAEELGAQLIVLGTHGKKGLQKVFGSYALKVITQAEAATLVVQKKQYTDYDNVLFPVNSFTEARQKVQYAIAVHRRFKSHINIYKEQVKDPGEMNRINVITKQIIEEFKKARVDYSVHTAVKSGESVKQLIDFSVANKIDMIMIVTEAQLGTSYFSLGPWNEKIMFNEAQIPVMCINPVQKGYVYFDL